MSQQFVQFFQHVERNPAEAIHRTIRAQDLEIESVAVESDNACEILQLPEKLFRVRLEPASEAALPVPGDCDGDTEMSNVRPAALHFMGQPQSFNVQKDLAIEESRQIVPCEKVRRPCS